MWREGIDALAAAIRAHAQYRLASHQYIAAFVTLRINIGVLNKVTSNLAREHILEHLLYLHFAGDAVAGETGASFAHLADLSESRDQIGARAVRTALRLAQTAGLVIPLRSRNDARLRIYAPTEALISLTRDHSVLTLGVLDALSPGMRLATRMRDAPNAVAAMLERMGAAYLVDGPGPNAAPDALTALLRLEGGRTTLAVVIDCHWRGLALPTLEHLSKRFYVSSSQSRAILRQAEALGLIRIAARGQVLEAAKLAQLYLDALARYTAFASIYGLGLDVDDFDFGKPPH